MKTLKTLLTAFLVLMLCACTGTKEEESPYEIAGKTYYNTVDQFGLIEHSKIWFGSDNSFVLSDNFYDGTYEISGNWSIKGNVITLDVTSSGVGEFKTIKFEINENDELTLKNTLAGSLAEDIFVTKDKLPENPVGTQDSDDGWYYNSSRHTGFDDSGSHLELYDDGTFVLVEIMGMGADKIEGRWGQEGNVLMFSNFDKFTDMNGNEVYNFEFFIGEDGRLTLNEDLIASCRDDIFTLDKHLLIQGPPIDFMSCSYLHSYIDGVDDAYLPSVTFEKDGTFIIFENCYSGIGNYKGIYELNDKGYILTVTDASGMQGYTGENVTKIYFDFQDDETLILKTDLCMSMSGDLFFMMY